MTMEQAGGGNEPERLRESEERLLEKEKQYFFDHLNFLIKHGVDVEGRTPLDPDQDYSEEFPNASPIYASHQIYEISPDEDLIFRIVDDAPIKELHFPLSDFEVKLVAKKNDQDIEEVFDVDKNGRILISMSIHDNSQKGKEFRERRNLAYKKAGNQLNDAIMMHWIEKEHQEFGGFFSRPASLNEVRRINDALRNARDSRPFNLAEARAEEAPVTEETRVRLIERIDELVGPLSGKDLMYGEDDSNVDMTVQFATYDAQDPKKMTSLFSLYVHGELLSSGKVFTDERRFYRDLRRRADGLYERLIVTFNGESVTQRIDLASEEDYKKAKEQVGKIMDGTMSIDEFMEMMHSHDISMAVDKMSEGPLKEIEARFILSLLNNNPRELHRTDRSGEDS